MALPMIEIADPDHSRPLFSIVIPAYNVEGCIARAVESVIGQTCQDFEIIIIDDSSKDETVVISRQLALKHNRIRVLEQATNQGPSSARNRGIDESRGHWIAILDADDAFGASRLQNLAEFATRHDADIVADNLALYDQGLGEIVGNAFSWRTDFALTLDDLLAQDVYLRGVPMGWIKPVFRRQYLLDRGLRYPPEYRHAEDFFLLASALAEGALFWISSRAEYVYTTRMGLVSREASPFSASSPNLESIALSCDQLLKEYGPKLSRKQTLGLERRKARFKNGGIAIQAINEARQGRKFSAALRLLRNPCAAAILVEKAASKALNFIVSRKK